MLTALFKERGLTSVIYPSRPKNYLTGFESVSICIRVISFSSIETQKKSPYKNALLKYTEVLKTPGSGRSRLRCVSFLSG